MELDQLTIHERVHVFYRQKLSETEWELAQALGMIATKDKIIAELTELLETATTP